MANLLKDESLQEYRQKFSKPDIKIDKPYGCQTPWPKADSLATDADSTAVETE
jgi:hypothetical protein